MKQGIFYIVSAPSGSGKSSLISALIKTDLLCKVAKISVSYTTRKIRPGEIHGKHYFFVSKKEFKKMISEDAFLEYAKIFDKYYGTSRKIVDGLLNSGVDIFLDIDWQGAKQIRDKIVNSCSVFIFPPSKYELKRRLLARGQNTKEDINQRMVQAMTDMSHYEEYDYLIVNDNFDMALLDFKNIICAERLRMFRQKIKQNVLISELLVF